MISLLYYPKIVSEWLEEENGPISESISINSHKKVWWVCSKGHRWQAIIGNRVRLKSGCPYCSNRKVGYGNDLASTHPELVKDLHPTKNKLSPSSVTYGTKVKFVWVCTNSHYWSATPYDKLRGRSCPYCLNRKLGQGNDLQSQYPNLAKEWCDELNGFPASKQVSGTFFNAWWKCSKCGNKWSRDVKGRVDGAGCPICKQKQSADTRIERQILFGGSFKDNHPLLVKEWHPTKNPLSSDKYLSGSGKKVWWLCPRGHDYKMSIKERTKKNAYGCPKCSGNTSKVEIRTLSELLFVFNELRWRERIGGHEADIWSKEFNFIIEVDGYPWHKGKEKRDKIKQQYFESLGITVFRLRDIRLTSIGNYEIKFRSDSVSNSLLHESIKQLVQLILVTSINIPIGIRQASEEYIKSKAYCGDKYYQEYLKYYRGPPPGKSLKAMFPSIAKEWSDKNYIEPDQVSCGSKERYWFICPKGHKYNQTIGSRTYGKANCPICANRRVLKGYNDLESNYPDIAKEWSKNNKYKPSEMVYGSKKKMLWNCMMCEKEYESSVRNRTQKGTKCPSCSRKEVWTRKKQKNK